MRTPAALTLLLAVAGGCSKPAPRPEAPGAVVLQPDNLASDKDRFQGVWKIESADTGEPGKTLARQSAFRFQFQGDRARIRDSAGHPGESFVANWDTTKTPHTLTLSPLSPDGQPAPGQAAQVWIYQFEGGTLVVAFRKHGPPPTAFGAHQRGEESPIVLRLIRANELPDAPPAPAGTAK